MKRAVYYTPPHLYDYIIHFLKLLFILYFSGVPYNDNDGSTFHAASSSPLKRKRTSCEGLNPTTTQCFVLSDANFENFKKCIHKVDKHSEMIKARLHAEMMKIQDSLSSDSEEEQEEIIHI